MNVGLPSRVHHSVDHCLWHFLTIELEKSSMRVELHDRLGIRQYISRDSHTTSSLENLWKIAITRETPGVAKLDLNSAIFTTNEDKWPARQYEA